METQSLDIILNDKDFVEEIVNTNLDFVWYIMKKYLPNDYFHEKTLGGDDLYACGCEGLVKAAQRFDKNKGFEFSTYAGHMILGEMKRFKRDKGSLIKIPRDFYALKGEYYRITKEKDISDKEACEMLGLSEYEFQRMINVNNLSYLDQVVSADEGKPILLQDKIGDSVNQIEDMIDTDERLQKLEIYKKILTKKQLNVLECIIQYQGTQKQKEIGEILGVSQVQISRMTKRVMEATPLVCKVYEGEITLQQAREQFVGTRGIKQITQVKEDSLRRAKLKNFRDNVDIYIKALTDWLISHPGEKMNVSAVLREAKLDIPNGQTRVIKASAEEDLINRGYTIEKVIGSKGKGMDLILVGKEDHSVLTFTTKKEQKEIADMIEERGERDDGTRLTLDEVKEIANNRRMQVIKEEPNPVSKEMRGFKDMWNDKEDAIAINKQIMQFVPMENEQTPTLSKKSPIEFLRLEDICLTKSTATQVAQAIDSIYNILSGNKEASITLLITETETEQ